jgi:YidC/Oxa1 family membrane protein insertase
MILANVLTPLENIVRSVLLFLHTDVGLTWAWSIVGLTIIVRIVLVPLTVRQIHSMQNLQRHAPQMKEIQKKYKGDRQRMNEELMKFYKENKINPASSCLPLLLQLPVFLSLYLVLKHFDFKAHGGSLSWLGFVPDITAHANSHWSGYVLLVVYAASQVASTMFMSTTMDKTQRYVLMALPIFFIFIVARFPAGLVLYWMTTNLWTVGQGLVTRRLVPKTPAPQRRTSRTPPREQPAEAAQPVEEAATADGEKPAPAKAQQQPQVRRVKRKKRRARR